MSSFFYRTFHLWDSHLCCWMWWFLHLRCCIIFPGVEPPQFICPFWHWRTLFPVWAALNTVAKNTLEHVFCRYMFIFLSSWNEWTCCLWSFTDLERFPSCRISSALLRRWCSVQWGGALIDSQSFSSHGTLRWFPVFFLFNIKWQWKSLAIHFFPLWDYFFMIDRFLGGGQLAPGMDFPPTPLWLFHIVRCDEQYVQKSAKNMYEQWKEWSLCGHLHSHSQG